MEADLKAPTAVASTPAGHINEPIDRAYLARFTLGNMALEREILELFAGQLQIYVEQLRTAAGSKEWKLAAHTIKGSALAVGARHLAELAQIAERLDGDAHSLNSERVRREAAEAVAAASDHACRYIARLFTGAA